MFKFVSRYALKKATRFINLILYLRMILLFLVVRVVLVIRMFLVVLVVRLFLEVIVVRVVRVFLLVLHKVPGIVCRYLHLMVDFFNKEKQLCKTEKCLVDIISNTII